MLLDATGGAAELRVGFSLRSAADARAGVDAAAHASFDEVADASWRAWNGALGRVDVRDDASTPGAMVAAARPFLSVPVRSCPFLSFTVRYCP